MNKNKSLRLEIMMACMLLMFAVLIIFGERLHPQKEEPVEEETIEVSPVIDYEKIRSISGKYSYDDENFHGSFGIDVSEFQDDINWEKVSKDSVEFVYIRIGRRGATTGLLYDDPKFETNYKGARDNGIPVGIYFFSQAVNEEEAIEEAKWVMERIKDRQLDLPIVYDLEEVILEDEKSRLEGIDKKQLTDNALAFMNELKNNGYDTMFYTYQYWAENFYEMDRLSEIPLWFAQYDVKAPVCEYPISIWQYSNKGTINGISQPVDLNIMFTRKNDLSE